MKHVTAVAVVVSLLLAVGCAERQQVKVTFLSDPPGGRLYKQNGQLWGPCPKVLWYDVDSDAMEKGHLDAKGLTVRWPTGPEKRSGDLIKITINGTDRQVIFVQPRQESKLPGGDSDTDNSKEMDKKAADWQKARKTYSAESERIRTSLALMAKNPVVADGPVASLPGRTLTLEPRQLMLLDFSSLNRRGARVEGRKAVSGPGVEFVIYFPDNNPGSCSLSFVSSGTGGRGALVGADIRAYEAFALKLTLVSINGQSDPKLKQKLVAGAVIGPTATGRLTSYEPVTLSLSASEKTATAVTAASADEIYEIGFHIHAENREDWDATGSRVVLKVEAAEGGEAGAFNAPGG